MSTSGSDPTFTYDSIGDEHDATAHRTRAQKVHSSNTFQGISSAQTSGVSVMGRLKNNLGAVSKKLPQEEIKPILNNFLSSDNSVSSESSVQSSRKETKLPVVVNEPEAETKQSSPRNEQAKAAAIITER